MRSLTIVLFVGLFLIAIALLLVVIVAWPPKMAPLRLPGPRRRGSLPGPAGRDVGRPVRPRGLPRGRPARHQIYGKGVSTVPVSPRSAATPEQQTDNKPDRLRPYEFHGVGLTTRGKHAVGDCQFCGKEGKFSVEVDTGLWRCLVCGTG